ncbi:MULTISPECIES: ABC transporter permease [unclassified Rhodococcus (in: high G+C Gram-positive bacteria)]|uniref:ABC transporter permease n=1 Tax=unclassified Rhodococcus (in: high G+C Gram-positive bacteria) TaxID=192944 RepID=UPI0007BC4437|nr:MULTISPECIES: ABC transporter permease [unclassified Rhodococcus (in: high G+C Gram-positive bacteria)]KZF08353.1 ABC transporter permease [Rhodococcus sp. EPR-147]KZF09918.1 ABC transporter permease [Rhodococcus sp. EPR-279]OZE30401.1 ABC transporter permease [Rhodococcus sp. 05-2254-6]OZF46710.1 ABC transporter permease [Rhodococcus sp. 14-1411-2a]
MGVLAAERIKFTSTKSPWWCSAIIVVLGLGFAAILGWAAQLATDTDAPEGIPPTTAADVVGLGVGTFGSMVLMILAALTVTSEYRFGLIRTTFQAVTNRGSVLAAKALLVGVYGAILSFVLAVIGLYLAKALAGEQAGALLGFDIDGTWRILYGTAILAFVQVVLAIGVGALMRQSAGAIAILLLWPLLIENLVGVIPTVGEKIQPFLPFLNANHFLGSGGGVDFHWGPIGGLIYFVAFTAVIFGAAVFVVNRRDA